MDGMMTQADFLLMQRGQLFRMYQKMVHDVKAEIIHCNRLTPEELAKFEADRNDAMSEARTLLREVMGVEHPVVHPCEVMLKVYHEYLGREPARH